MAKFIMHGIFKSKYFKTGISYNRSVEDENMVLLIGNPSLEF
jgi:hypothetical protein